MNPNSLANLKPFEPGTDPRRNRKGKGESGFSRAKRALEKLVGEISDNGQLDKMLRAEWEANPRKFWLEFCVPMIPKETKIGMGDDAPIKIIIASPEITGAV